MRCQVDSYPKAEIKWSHNSTELIKKTNVHISQDNSSVRIEKVNFDDLGFYSCEASNGYEKLLLNGTLSVHGLGKFYFYFYIHKYTSRFISCAYCLYILSIVIIIFIIVRFIAIFFYYC